MQAASWPLAAPDFRESSPVAVCVEGLKKPIDDSALVFYYRHNTGKEVILNI